jgi:oligoribonuclease NrnB/cAMP/cGMP phosphodiesterase (DHH superfamily)
MKKSLIIYHANCADGFASAWVAWKKLGDDNTEFLAASYGDAPPDVTEREVVIVDFSYPREALLRMKAQARGLIVLDHHKTAQADLQGLETFAVFDQDRSGAGLAWATFFDDQPVSWVVQYVQDRDLWRFKLPDSKEINAWIGVVPRTFRDWELLEVNGREAALLAGRAVQRTIDDYVEKVAQDAMLVVFDGRLVPLVNASYPHTSELLHRLAKDHPFAVSWQQRRDGRYRYSLRSADDGADVASIAKRYGGGGHTHAAGFERDAPLKFEGCQHTMVGGRCFNPSCPLHGTSAQP